MRFIRLKLNNITSLRGEHVLDFGEALGNEELFAITGATGSGKSSLLTAISLALYGNTYKKTLNQWEYVTQDEEEGSIDLEFSSGGVQYRALWRCKKHIDKHGVLRPKYSRELLASGTPTDIPIEDVVGLNFEQFKKTIILNQGQFAEFLTATFTERKAILENLANAELLSKLGKGLKERVREMARIQGELEARLEGGLPFSDEELKHMRQRVKELEKERPQLEKVSNRFEQDAKDLKELLKWSSDIARYRAEDEGARLELQSANDLLQKNKNEQREWQVEFDQFISHRDQRRPKLQQALQLEKTLETKKVQEQALASKDVERSKREQKWEEEFKNLGLRKSQIAQELEDNVVDMDFSKLSSTSHKAVEALMGEWDEALKKEAINASKLGNIQERMEETQKRGSNIAKEIEQDKKNLDQIEKQGHDPESVEKLNQQLETLTRDLPLWEEYGRSLEDLERRKKQKQSELNERNEQITARAEKLKLLELELENLRLKKRQHELEHALGLVRKVGADEGHCPACGQQWPDSIQDSPVGQHTPQLQKLAELEKSVATESAHFESLKTRAKEIEAEIDHLTKNIAETKTKQEQIELNLAQKDGKIDIVSLRQQKASLSQELKVAEQSVLSATHLRNDLIKKEKIREEMRLEWNKLSKSKEELESEIKNNVSLISRSIKDLTSRLPNLPPNFDEARVFIKEQNNITNLRAKLEQELKSIDARIDAGNKEAKERAQDRDGDAKLRTALLQEIQHARETLKPLVPEGDVTKAIKALEDQEETWGLQKDKWSARIKELEQKAETARTRHGFINEQLKKARSELERTLAIISNREVLKSNDSHIGFERGMQKLRQLKRSQEVEESLAEITLWQNDFFTPKAEAAKQALKACDTELIELNKSLDIDAKKRQEMDKFKKELEVAQTQKSRWDALASVLGQDEFRGFALGLVEERLVEQTNRELEHLCEGRYQITLLENKKQSQDFLVIDHWRGGGERKVSTLSGGETFLVSLAMALSLAELTRGQTEVDAFFIDEGFGTLDRDSIDDVLEVLSNVQSRGKQIGLISHVKALTDRIPVNLHLEKSTLGDSKIKIVYN